MKFSTFISLTLLLSSVGKNIAFVMPQPPMESLIRLEATKNHKRRWKAIVSGGMMGWALATQLASATPITQGPAIEQGKSKLGVGITYIRYVVNAKKNTYIL